MPTYKELVGKYQKRRRDTLVDAVTTGLTYADDMAVELSVLDDTGLLPEILDTAASALPFAVIAVTEQCKVFLGRKSQLAGAQDATFRMLKTGAAMGVGAAATALGAPLLAAVPAAISVRVILDKYKSRAMTGARVDRRIARLRAIRERLDMRRLEG